MRIHYLIWNPYDAVRGWAEKEHTISIPQKLSSNICVTGDDFTMCTWCITTSVIIQAFEYIPVTIFMEMLQINMIKFIFHESYPICCSSVWLANFPPKLIRSAKSTILISAHVSMPKKYNIWCRYSSLILTQMLPNCQSKAEEICTIYIYVAHSWNTYRSTSIHTQANNPSLNLVATNERGRMYRLPSLDKNLLT